MNADVTQSGLLGSVNISIGVYLSLRQAQSLLFQEDQLLGNNCSSRHLTNAGSDSESESRQRMEPRSAMSTIQPLLQSYGMGNSDSASKSKKVRLLESVLSK